MIINMTGGGGGTGATLTVNSNGSGTVTVSNATLGKSYSKPIAAGGSAEFKGLATGTWTVTLSGNGQPATRTVIVTADYSVNISYFSATINITYPEGSTVTATDGESTFTAPDTSGTWTLIVPNAGSWAISSTNGTDTASETVEITTEGQSVSVELSYSVRLYWYGDECEANGGIWTNTGYSRSGYTLKAPTKYESYMLVQGNGNNKVNGFAGKEEPINLTGRNIITAVIDSVGGESGYMLVLGSKSFSGPSGAAAYVQFPNATGSYTATLDVGNLQGDYYLAFMTGVSNNRGFKLLEVLAS